MVFHPIQIHALFAHGGIAPLLRVSLDKQQVLPTNHRVYVVTRLCSRLTVQVMQHRLWFLMAGAGEVKCRNSRALPFRSACSDLWVGIWSLYLHAHTAPSQPVTDPSGDGRTPLLNQEGSS